MALFIIRFLDCFLRWHLLSGPSAGAQSNQHSLYEDRAWYVPEDCEKPCHGLGHPLAETHGGQFNPSILPAYALFSHHNKPGIPYHATLFEVIIWISIALRGRYGLNLVLVTPRQ
jgi:hypothetical protein